ncbi:hypothetical protein P3T27_004923 [Kitasatospora sp. MAA19]|nr:hypothetical protein [Kitasatospora sp. MAA19]
MLGRYNVTASTRFATRKALTWTRTTTAGNEPHLRSKPTS